jgi:DNA-binding CsgD family transcriptional regulator
MMGTVAAHLPTFPRHTAEWIVVAAISAELSVRLDLPALRTPVYEALSPLAERQVAPRAQSPSLGPVSLYLGRLALADQRWTAAGDHLRQALDDAIATCSPPFEAMTRVEMAELSVARRGNGDLHEARKQAAAALKIAEKYGMLPLAERARSLGRSGAGEHPGGLSDREWKIAGLIADGDRNRKIAERLRISERTVETHVRSILNKLCLGSRAGIASWYASHHDEDDKDA